MSQYFLKRCGLLEGGFTEGKRRKYPKLNLVVDCATHLILGLFPSRGPAPDFHQFKPALATLPPTVRINSILADAGYDSESNHVHARETLKIKTLIPPRIRATDTVTRGRYRKLMVKRFERKPRIYGQRWQVETVVSMLKRRFGSALSARLESMQNRELYLRTLVLNFAILVNA